MRRLTIFLLVLYTVLSAYSALRVGFGLPFLPFFTPLLTLLAFTFCPAARRAQPWLAAGDLAGDPVFRNQPAV